MKMESKESTYAERAYLGKKRLARSRLRNTTNFIEFKNYYMHLKYIHAHLLEIIWISTLSILPTITILQSSQLLERYVVG